MARLLAILILAALLATRSVAFADDEDLLNLIPETSPQSAPVQSTDRPYHLKTFIEDELQYGLVRDTRIPDGDIYKWLNRLSLDLRADLAVSPELSINISNRINLLNSGINTSLLNDYKEFYAAYKISDGVYLDAGRINIRNGTAVGYNPTDYFKVFAANNRISDDPSVLMDNRLGTVVLRAQALFEKGSLTLAYAPPLANPQGAVWTAQENSFANLGRTNSRSRLFASLAMTFLKNINPEILFYNEAGAASAGLNLSAAASESVIVYVEYNGRFAPNLLAEAAKSTGMPLSLSGSDSGNRLRNQLAPGVSISPIKDVNTWIEYHYNGSGLTRGQWTQWSNSAAYAQTLMGSPATHEAGNGMLGELWTLRQWALAEQEPLCRHYLFYRAAWQKVITRALDLTSMTAVNLYDWSYFIQNTAEYHIGGAAVLSLTLQLNQGGRSSEFGSAKGMGKIKTAFRYYF
ncbi:MAG: hypothetical protein L7F77_00820 [Candidatus Magnetominusculus sp. LBB02]|nr:hypothetical protein [Candidatus Magnetominusculus sp. LBB02]